MADRFVDTGGWAAWANDRDIYHASARAALAEVWQSQGRLVTTNLVLIELTALLLRMRIGKAHQVRFFDEMGADLSVLVVPVEPTVEAAAWALWRSRLD